jgi:DNA-directed RNA polymerase specialized sigma24 family protein
VGHFAEASGKGLRAFLDALHTAPAVVEDIGQHQELGCSGLVGDVLEAERAELSARVRDAMMLLPAEQRKALRGAFGLDEAKGAGTRAVARDLGVTESEASEIIRQGLASMSAMLAEVPCTYTS